LPLPGGKGSVGGTAGGSGLRPPVVGGSGDLTVGSDPPPVGAGGRVAEGRVGGGGIVVGSATGAATGDSVSSGG
jgi:hypothetical protein